MIARRARGTGLATVLMVSTVLLVVAFTVVGLGFNHLNVSNRMSNTLEARDLAEAAVSKAIENLLCDQTYGQRDGTGASTYTGSMPTTVVVTFPEASGANGVVTFKTSDANAYHLPLSYNNFGNTNTMPGSLGRTVPINGVQVIGVGTCNGATKTIESVIYIPKFPDALACTGQVTTGGGLNIAAVNSLADVNNPAKQLKSKIAANGSGTAINLQNTTAQNNINGDVQSVSGANVVGTNVTGEVRTYSAPEPIPSIDVTQYDPTGKPGLTTLSSDTGPSTALSGFNRYPTSVPSGFSGRTLTFNSLSLNSGVLYVDGNLNVQGGISGQGAIICTGTTNISGGGSLVSDNQVALLSKSDISLTGSSSNTVALTGLVYSGGSFDSSYANVSGVVIANDGGSGSNHVNMTFTNMTQASSNVSFAVSTGTSGGGGVQVAMGMPANGNPYSIPASSPSPQAPAQGNIPLGSTANWVNGFPSASPPNPPLAQYSSINEPTFPLLLAGPSAAPSPCVVGSGVSAPVNVAVGLDMSHPISRFTDASGNFGVTFTTVGGIQSNSTPSNTTLPQGNYQLAPYPAGGPSAIQTIAANPGISPLSLNDIVVYVNGTPYPGTPASAWQNAIIAAVQAQFPASQASNITADLNGCLNFGSSTYIQMLLQAAGMQASLAANIVEANMHTTHITSWTASGGSSTMFAIDASSFINKADQVRMLYWREL